MTTPAFSVTSALLRIARKLEDATLIMLLAAMIGLAVAQIVMRNLLGSGIAWGDPLLRVLVLWVGLAGAIVATREDNHIAINVLSRLLPAAAQAVSRIIVNLFAAIVCGVVAYHSARFVYAEYNAQTIAFGETPAWVCQLILPVAFGVITVRFTALALLHGRALRKHSTHP